MSYLSSTVYDSITGTTRCLAGVGSTRDEPDIPRFYQWLYIGPILLHVIITVKIFESI